MKKPYDIIKIDKYTKKIQTPTLLLMNRLFDVIGKINRFDNWNISLVANGIDEISFEVHKYVNGKLNPVWNDLTDLKIVDVDRFGRFEISVDYTDNTETVKLVCGQSLEVELGQIGIYELHINDEDDISYENYKPTVFYNHDDEEHSLLHRVLADKAPHWSIGYVTPFIALDEEYQPESSSTFQRTYTVDGETIYDFLTGTVAEESNVIFVFDTINRKINCYSLCDCINQDTGEIVCYGIGEDTNVLISKNKLANEISISSNKDNVKNCFRIVGGDDVITDMVRAVNMTGSNYIYVFSDFQLNDMSEELRKKIKAYQEKISSKELQDEYYGENGIYTRLCKAYEDLLYYESSMMPNVEIKETTAQEQYELVKQQLINNHVGVYSFANYNNTYFSGVTNCIEEMANVYVDSRYEISISKALSYTYKNGDTTGTWTGNIKVTNVGDETEYYPKTEEEINRTFSIAIEDDGDKLLYTKQKIEKALSKSSMLDIDFDVAEMTEEEMRDYFNLYSLNRLKSFAEGYNDCLSVLMQLGETTTTDIQNEIYSKYVTRFKVISNPPTSENPFPNPLGILEIRQKQVDDINTEIVLLTEEQKNFLEKNQLNLQEFLGDKLYKDFCKYRREDTYTNSNYISDGYSTYECLARAKELIDVATKEAKKACVLQRTVSTSLNNLFALSEFENLYDKFSLFNYIRVRTEDEILKLRLIGVEFNGDSVEEIQVTFSDQIESVDNKISDVQSIYQQMSSVATTFPSTALQAKQGANANNEIVDFYTNGLNATKTIITNNDNNEVTITNSGLLAKRMDDAGYYGEKQLRITGNGMYLTDDAWKSLKMAVGEIIYTNPITSKEEKNYGIIASTIIGELIAGKQMHIGNENGSVLITGDGIKISKGTIEWGDVNSPTIDDIPKLTDSLNEVDLHLEQLDGRIQTFSQTSDPSLNWTNDEKQLHIDDLWVNPDNGLTKQWNGTKWILVTDENLKNLASSKAQIFTSQPTIPYYVGDLWVQGKTGDIMHCKTTKESGEFESDDWVISSKYTNDEELYKFIDGTFTETISEIGTKIDGKADTYYQADAPHPNYTNVANNDTYNLWVGDMWYDTDTSETFMYQRTDLGNSKYNYKWEFMNVPKVVFDEIDGIRTIYTKLPLPIDKTANQGDLLIPDEDFSYNEISYIAKKVYKYVGISWIEIDYTNDDYAKKVEKNLNSYKEEIENFKIDVNAALIGGKTSIGEDYVISPKIGGGYLYIKDTRETDNTGISVEINPNGTRFTGHNEDYVFNVQKDDSIIMGVTNEGNGYFGGKINTSSGLIAGLHIDRRSLSCKLGIDYTKLPVDENGKYYFDYPIVYYDVNDWQKNNPHEAIIRSYYDENIKSFYCCTYEDVYKNLKLDGNEYSGYLNEELTGTEYTYIRYYNFGELDFIYNSNTNIKYYHIKTSKVYEYTYNTSDPDIMIEPEWRSYKEFNTNKDGSGETLILYMRESNPLMQQIGGNNYILHVEKIVKDMLDLMDTKSGSYGEETSLYIDQNGLSVGECAEFDIITNTSKIQNINCSLIPYIDSTYDIGSPYKRWKTLYSSTSSIVTSDKNKKYDVNYDIDKYVALFDKLKPCSFKYKDGTSGRIHIGYIAQDVENAMKELELEDTEFAGLCKDKVGNTWIYSLRYDEFQGIYDAKIKQLEERLAKIENYILNNKEFVE